jgi:hypothetical protein
VLIRSRTSQALAVERALFGGQARIRTLEDISQQIYSLPPLAAWVPALRIFSVRRRFRTGSLFLAVRKEE